ncbi:MAG: VCBS repeat-containing protein, partial [Planctomycetota bacterium]|nr:VCBS repeat-containing protein [Planctomycetota bacterium]
MAQHDILYPGEKLSVGQSPTSVVTADLNGDGLRDLAVSNFGDNSVSLLWGVEGGGFSPEVRINVGEHPNAVIAADLNGDGHLDLATSNYGSSDVSVLL